MNSGTMLLLLSLLFCIQIERISSLQYRLNSAVLPDVYDITIKPYLLPQDGEKQFTFDGQVNITLHAITASISNITLHKDYIEIEEVILYDATGKLVENLTNRQSYETQTDKLTVQLSSVLQVNTSYTLYFRYVGQIRNGLAGFYRASYTDSDGNQKWIGITQSQRINARTILPCFDEPALKSIFKMQISRPRDYNTVFNTRIFYVEADGTDRYMDHFEATPLMSTYLLAFVISDFVARGNEILSIIVRREFYSKTAFSYDVALKTLAAYDNYTQLPYQQLGNSIMQKIGTPVFPHNGMENWGLVIYKDSVLVQEPHYTDGWSNKQYTATIIVHETSHMWFGNSVTFAWWSYFWLNEAFARYYEYFFTHDLYPEYQLDQQFVVNQMHLIFGTDARNSTQPLTSNELSVETPAQIANKFSGITYAKGACIIRMFRNAMGHDQFDNAVRDYLKENHLKNTVPADLFLHLKRHWPSTQQVDLDQLFYDWTEQVGFPVLSVSLNGERSKVSITQNRFLLSDGDGSDATLKYTIPITYFHSNNRISSDLKPQFYLNRTQDTFGISFDRPIDWIIFNTQQTAYYRVLYDTVLLRRIKTALMDGLHGAIHVTNRAQLIDDLFNFALVDTLEYDLVFEFLEYLALETEYLPWYAAFSGLTRIAQRTPMIRQPDLANYLQDIMQKVYNKLGFEAPQDTVLDVYNRNRVVKWSCKYYGETCKKDALAAFEKMKETGVKPAPDFRETVYCSANRVGYDAHFFYLMDMFVAETFTSEKEMIIRAMGCTREYRAVSTYYAFILSAEIPQEYKESALRALYSENAVNVEPVFNMMNETIERLGESLGSWSTTANVISDIANYFTTEEQKENLEALIENNGHLFGTSISVLEKAVITVEANLLWADLRLPKLFTYLDGRNGAATNTLTTALLIFAAILGWLIRM